MSRIELVLCDGCGKEIEEGGDVTTIALPDADGEWTVLDLCSKDCVMKALGMDEEGPGMFQEAADEGILDEEGNLLPEEDAPRLVLKRSEPSEDDPPHPLSMNDRLANEKRFKEQAEQLSRHLGVGNRSKGER